LVVLVVAVLSALSLFAIAQGILALRKFASKLERAEGRRYRIPVTEP
jgi:hypothetical protein